MDFNDSPSEATFREEVREWLAENAPKFTTEGLEARDDGEGRRAAKRPDKIVAPSEARLRPGGSQSRRDVPCAQQGPGR